MRFRPLGKSGMVVSTISLSLTDRAAVARPSDWVALIYSAFENGINAFEIHGDTPGMIDGLSQALKAVERRLVYIAWRVGTRMGPAGVLVRDFSAGALCPPRSSPSSDPKRQNGPPPAVRRRRRRAQTHLCV